MLPLIKTHAEMADGTFEWSPFGFVFVTLKVHGQNTLITIPSDVDSF